MSLSLFFCIPDYGGSLIGDLFRNHTSQCWENITSTCMNCQKWVIFNILENHFAQVHIRVKNHIRMLEIIVNETTTKLNVETSLSNETHNLGNFAYENLSKSSSSLYVFKSGNFPLFFCLKVYVLHMFLLFEFYSQDIETLVWILSFKLYSISIAIAKKISPTLSNVGAFRKIASISTLLTRQNREQH